MFAEEVEGAFSLREFCQVEVELGTESLLKVLGSDSTLDGDDLRVPVELSEEFEKKPEQVHHCRHLEVVDQKNY